MLCSLTRGGEGPPQARSEPLELGHEREKLVGVGVGPDQRRSLTEPARVPVREQQRLEVCVRVDLPLPAAEEEAAGDLAVAAGVLPVEARGARVLEQPRQGDSLDEFGERAAVAGLAGPVGRRRCGRHGGQGTRWAKAEGAESSPSTS